MLIAQISDPHIRPPGLLYKDQVPSNAMLAQALAHVAALDVRPDLLLLTGDVTEDGTPEAYAEARRLLSACDLPLLAIPGNHDDREAFRAAFADQTWMPREGPLHWCVDRDALRLIGLDCTVPGRHHGALDAASLAWLDQALADAPERPTMLVLHHPPFMSGIWYMDAYRYRDDAPLAEVVRRHPQVEAVLCGHMHRVMFRRWAGTVVASAPSTCTEIDIRLKQGAAPQSFVGPRGYLLHRWNRSDGFVTHLMSTAQAEGPYPFY